MYVINNGLNEASFRHKLDLISKNIIKNQNSIKLLFKDVKHFDAQNPLTGSLIREVDIGKKKGLSKFFDKAPDIRDLSLGRLNKLRDGEEFFNRGDDNNNNNNNNNNNDDGIFFCRLLHLRLILIFQTKQGSDHFQKLEVFKMMILTIFNLLLHHHHFCHHSKIFSSHLRCKGRQM